MKNFLIGIILILSTFIWLSAEWFSEDRRYIVSNSDTFFNQEDIDKIKFRVENSYKSNDRKFFKYDYKWPQDKVKISISNFSYDANSEIWIKKAILNIWQKVKAERGMVIRTKLLEIKWGKIAFMIFKEKKNYWVLLLTESWKNTFTKAKITTDSFKRNNFKRAFSLVLSDMDYPKMNLWTQREGQVRFWDYTFLKSDKVIKYNDVFLDWNIDILWWVKIVAKNRELLESDFWGKNVAEYLAQIQEQKSGYSLSKLSVEENEKWQKYIIAVSNNNKKSTLKTNAKYLTEVIFAYKKDRKIHFSTLNFLYSNKIYEKKIAEILEEVNIIEDYPFYFDDKNIKIWGNYAKNNLDNLKSWDIVYGQFDFKKWFCSVELETGTTYSVSPCEIKRSINKNEEDQEIRIYIKSNIRNSDFGYELETKWLPDYTIYSWENSWYSRWNVYLKKKIKASNMEKWINKWYINIKISDFKTNKTKNLRVYLELDVK